jgi:methionine-rich copper-binding protein CopC
MRALCLLVLAMLGPALPAWAHAALERAVPPVGSQVDQPPRQVVLTFTEGVEPAFSTIELRGAGGTAIATGKPQSVNGNKRQLEVDLPALAAGTYTVVWHATSVDTHKTEGSFQFTVH